MDTWLLIALLALAGVGVLLQLLLWWRKPAPAAPTLDEIAHRQTVLAQLHQITQRVEHVEGELRREVADNARHARLEQQQSLNHFQESLTAQSAETTRTQNAQLDGFAQQLVQLRGALGDALTRQLQDMSEANARRLAEIRTTLDAQLTQLQQGNAAKLDEMRAVVDEKLQSTLQARLGESFKQVADRLEQVHKGLGEMQTLAQGVGDLKHLLTNVKTRGMFGEAQLAALLEQVFAPDQYAAQVSTRPGSRNAVDFAVRLPGRGDDGAPCWLPIDAKFPNEDYERLLDAQQRADVDGAEAAARALEQRIRLEARSMAEKYLEPPHTTDFAILFLPTEGLYAEVLRRPGLMELLQREHRVTLAGPTTLMAMLNSLQMGFRTLALEKRSSEVWQVLGAVKTEFGKFGDTLARVKSQTQTVLNTLDQAEVRSRAMGRALKTVEALPQDRSSALLPLDSDPIEPEGK
ncbi:MAG: DNA recombination protein RmuC [Hydrogenophaga sp.]|uniref:DNA recombination protein RmuC n=1 Tax=Hydrogenophaga sp. TaxID=1904254 RepID=UPI0016B05789|nr:DNA recombination protein RmuC [Hydrogenophaga sp.]NIM43504.1 DNA recombination protein RmuC [Hydrogenophaga sp.]NIN28573.1 DNA recombination protein RmuC [Hydrogenophaga sp.]NIN33032.1 DNA recombination protein RmuC [Hydrogenophaga sp.]NIN57707.1 DNA recombination protein RmuC [Hydrogenophaga sp.]NIO54002.1 DNA recombination protein RmuC [Hydrogenophaga sp.]